MEKNIKEAIDIIEDVRKSMPECTNKAFLKGALNELNEALRLYAISSSVCTCMAFHKSDECYKLGCKAHRSGEAQTDC